MCRMHKCRWSRDAQKRPFQSVRLRRRTFRYAYANNNLVRFDSPLAVEGKIDSTTYAYYTTADGANLDHAMQSLRRQWPRSPRHRCDGTLA